MKKRCFRGAAVLAAVFALAMSLFLTAGTAHAEEEQEMELSVGQAETRPIPEIPGAAYESSMEFDFARMVNVYYFEGGYKVIDVTGDRQFLLVPEGKSVPEGTDPSIVPLYAPVDNIYLAATSAMALFDALDALDAIRLSSLRAEGWYIEHAAGAMERGDILFSGKYSEPDYELMIQEGCSVAIESMMILHTPKVQEMIENMGIPVFIDRSSSEEHPLGRTEWIRVYAAMLDKEAEADAFMEEQKKIISDLDDFVNTEKKVAYFYFNTDGSVVVRSGNDYVPKMIEIAGARYIPDDLMSETKRSSVPITLEEFYTKCIDADYLVYNASIDNPIETIGDLLGKSELFQDFKAVQEGNVWCTGKYLYQATDIVGNLIRDFHNMVTEGDPAKMTFLSKIEG